MPAAIGRRRSPPPISCSARPPAIRSIRWSRAAATCPPAASCSTSPAIASAASRRKCSTGCNRSACANMSASARRSEIQDFRARWMKRAEGFAAQSGPALPHRSGQRSVLRPRRQADGDEPGRAGVEIRAAGPGAFRRRADRLHELQLSPRPFRHDVEHLRTQPARPAHTGCVAFGIDRLALALFATHGVELAQWPTRVRQALTVVRSRSRRPKSRIRYRRDRRAAAAAGP